MEAKRCTMAWLGMASSGVTKNFEKRSIFVSLVKWSFVFSTVVVAFLLFSFQSIYYLVRADCWHILFKGTPESHLDPSKSIFSPFFFLSNSIYFFLSEFIRKLKIEMKKKLCGAKREGERKK